MNYNEAIKTLECCINGKCNECPLRAMNCSPKVAMAFSADIITRQKAEIERLEKECEEAWEAHSTQIEEYDKLFEEAQTLIKRSRAEAIKEFAERLAEKYACLYGYRDGLLEGEIDNLVKEMVGERE